MQCWGSHYNPITRKMLSSSGTVNAYSSYGVPPESSTVDFTSVLLRLETVLYLDVFQINKTATAPDADRLQRMVLCQVGPVTILDLDHHSCWLSTSDHFTLMKKSSDISCPIPKFLQLQRSPKICTAEKRRIPWCSSCLQLLWTGAKHSGLQQLTTTHEHFDRLEMILLQDHSSSTVYMCGLHTDTLAFHYSISTDYLASGRAQHYAE